jgi:hypothetical protein
MAGDSVLHRRSQPDEGLEKVQFVIEQDEDGYPPVSIETVWARRTSDGYYELDNSPFYATEVSWKDVVDIEEMPDGTLQFKRVVRQSGHSTIRVVALKKGEMEPLKRKLEEFGCSWEGGDVPSLISVDIPPRVDIKRVRSLLQEGSDNGFFDYEESSVQHP